MEDREPNYRREQTYWDNSKLDELTIQTVQHELSRKSNQRKRGQAGETSVGENPVAVSLETIREAIEWETGLTSLVAIDLSIRRVAIFDREVGGISGLKPEIIERLQKGKTKRT